MGKEIHVYDMDGTLICSLHRYKTIINKAGEEKIDLPYWRENSTPEKIMCDSLLPLTAQYRAQLRDPNIYVVIATARVFSDADYMFIYNILGKPNHIIHRKEGDNRRGAVMKLAGLRKLFSLKQFAKVTNRHFWEDNIDYLKICDDLNMIGHYIPSNQGH